MSDLTRKQFLSASVGVVAAALTPSLAMSQEKPIQKPDEKADPSKLTVADLEAAAKTAGVALSAEQLKPLLKDVQDTTDSFAELRKQTNDPFLVPATTFRVMGEVPEGGSHVHQTLHSLKRPALDEDLAFLSASELSHLIQSRQLTSVELTRLYLARLKRYGPKLRCVITLTEDLAIKQATKADKELASGKNRGPLHGLPYGLKDLFAVPGYPTTWGAEPYKTQIIDVECTVYEKLKAAGAVLVAKLSMGALAEGDNWFNGRTESPWDPKLGSSGSSAGSGSATAAGLVAFAIGTETSGSVVSPSHNCRVTGLRPTFGSISRYGAMALSYSMDKVGPLCRTAEDCALVFAALIGRDHRDPSSINRPFVYEHNLDVRKLRVGAFVKPENVKKPLKSDGIAAFETIKKFGFDAKPMTMDAGPDGLGVILVTEAAAAFDELTRNGHIDDIKGTGWPTTFRESRLIPAVELVLADRARRSLQTHYNDVFKQFDIVAIPNQGFDRVYQWNLTGHPQVLVPLGQNAKGVAQSLSLVGPLFSEGNLLAVAHQIQLMTGQTKVRPNMVIWE